MESTIASTLHKPITQQDFLHQIRQVVNASDYLIVGETHSNHMLTREIIDATLGSLQDTQLVLLYECSDATLTAATEMILGGQKDKRERHDKVSEAWTRGELLTGDASWGMIHLHLESETPEGVTIQQECIDPLHYAGLMYPRWATILYNTLKGIGDLAEGHKMLVIVGEQHLTTGTRNSVPAISRVLSSKGGTTISYAVQGGGEGQGSSTAEYSVAYGKRSRRLALQMGFCRDDLKVAAGIFQSLEASAAKELAADEQVKSRLTRCADEFCGLVKSWMEPPKEQQIVEEGAYDLTGLQLPPEGKGAVGQSVEVELSPSSSAPPAAAPTAANPTASHYEQELKQPSSPSAKPVAAPASPPSSKPEVGMRNDQTWTRPRAAGHGASPQKKQENPPGHPGMGGGHGHI